MQLHDATAMQLELFEIREAIKALWQLGKEHIAREQQRTQRCSIANVGRQFLEVTFGCAQRVQQWQRRQGQRQLRDAVRIAHERSQRHDLADVVVDLENAVARAIERLEIGQHHERVHRQLVQLVVRDVEMLDAD